MGFVLKLIFKNYAHGYSSPLHSMNTPLTPVSPPRHRVVKGHLLSAIFRERSKGKKEKLIKGSLNHNPPQSIDVVLTTKRSVMRIFI